MSVSVVLYLTKTVKREVKMDSTMQDEPLLLSQMLDYGMYANADSKIVTYDGQGFRSKTFLEAGKRAIQLSNALSDCGVEIFDRVATFCFNHQQHMECLLAIPSMGAIVHTINVRIDPDQIRYNIRHAQDKVLIYDHEAAPYLSKVRDVLEDIKLFIKIGDADDLGLKNVVDYEEFIADKPTTFNWPQIDEKKGAFLCYTSGTTGDPKGVLYSHRSTWIHSYIAMTKHVSAFSQDDTVALIVPLFHGNSWGMSYPCWLAGSDIVFPHRFVQPPHLVRIFNHTRPTYANGVPTIWNDLLSYSENHEIDLSSFREIVSGGSAVSKSLIEAYKRRFGVNLVQIWGMTELLIGAYSRPPRGVSEEERIDWLAKTGKLAPGIQMRITDEDGKELPRDGIASGEFEIKGPTVTGNFFGQSYPERFNNGWLRTGDVGSLTPDYYMQISDRSKDVIKSGGEWISSSDLENLIMGHPKVAEAAIVAVPDEKWEERPLACIVLKPMEVATAEELRNWLKERVVKWWVPERWCFIKEVPRTSVGKFDKKVLRARYKENKLEVFYFKD
jgi:fatty-acyl-CoA synthase